MEYHDTSIESKKRPSLKLLILLTLLTIFPPVISLITELNKTHLIWRIRIVDFLDLIVLAPFYIVTFFLLQLQFIPEDSRLLKKFISFSFIITFLYGHAMHMTANAINTYGTEIHNYLSEIPSDLYSLIYFFDENLGHWIMFVSLFVLFGFWSQIEKPFQSSHDAGRQITWMVTIGVLEGIFLGVAMIEGSQPILGYVFGALLFLCTLRNTLLRARQLGLVESLATYPATTFAMFGAAAILIAETVYHVIMGGFVQPSQITLIG
jgi:hypothetical protein